MLWLIIQMHTNIPTSSSPWISVLKLNTWIMICLQCWLIQTNGSLCNNQCMVLVCHLIGRDGKKLWCLIFLYASGVIYVKLCTMVVDLLNELYPFILVLMTCAVCQGRGSTEHFKQRPHQKVRFLSDQIQASHDCSMPGLPYTHNAMLTDLLKTFTFLIPPLDFSQAPFQSYQFIPSLKLYFQSPPMVGMVLATETVGSQSLYPGCRYHNCNHFQTHD